MTPQLSKAARALLDWQQKDLAQAAGLSLTAVTSFERGLGITRTGTVKAIEAALESAGIEFPPQGGLRLTSDISQVMRFAGDDFIARMNEDITSAVRQAGAEVLTCSPDENLWHGPKVRAAHEAYVAWREKLAIREKNIVPDGATVYNAPKSMYKHLPAETIGKIAYVLYADRIAFVLWRKKQVVIMRNAAIAETFRAQFNYLWKLARQA